MCQFREGGGASPFQITNENELAIGNTAGKLCWAGARVGDSSDPIPAAFPKGYAAFYGMKYEITQGQYADFLNTLAATQATARYQGTTLYQGKASRLFRYAVTNIDGVYSSSQPYVSCNYLSWADLAAYLDWAALRPMTELEFEKACRGPNRPVAGEYAWGDTNLVEVKGISNEGQTNEVPSNSNANCAASGKGPMRGGVSGSRQRIARSHGSGLLRNAGPEWEPVGANCVCSDWRRQEIHGAAWERRIGGCNG